MRSSPVRSVMPDSPAVGRRSSCDVRVRLRPERTASVAARASRGRRRPPPSAGGSRQGPSAGCRSTKRSSWRSSRTSASGSSGSTRRFRTSASRRRDRSGRRQLRHDVSPATRRRSRRPARWPARHQHRQRQRSRPASACNQTLPWGAHVQRRLEQLAARRRRTCSTASARCSARTSACSITQPLLRNF